MSEKDKNKNLLRWRFVLGRFAEKKLPSSMDAKSQRLEKALDFLYGREYQGRGLRGDGGSHLPKPTNSSALAWGGAKTFSAGNL